MAISGLWCRKRPICATYCRIPTSRCGNGGKLSSRGTKFKAWCFAIARFRVMEHRKRLQREHKLMFSPELTDMLGEVGTAGMRIRWKQSSALEACLENLRDKDRALIAARYETRTPLAEYAKTDGRSEPSLPGRPQPPPHDPPRLHQHEALR